MPKFKKNPNPIMKKRSGFTMKRGSSPLYKDLGSSPIEQDPPVMPDPPEDQFEELAVDTVGDEDIEVKEKTPEEKQKEKEKIQMWLDRAEQELRNNPPPFPPIKI